MPAKMMKSLLLNDSNVMSAREGGSGKMSAWYQLGREGPKKKGKFAVAVM